MGNLLVSIMSQFVLKIKLGNDAMQTGNDIAETLRYIADTIEDSINLSNYHEVKIFDINGNTVGSWMVK